MKTLIPFILLLSCLTASAATFPTDFVTQPNAAARGVVSNITRAILIDSNGNWIGTTAINANQLSMNGGKLSIASGALTTNLNVRSGVLEGSFSGNPTFGLSGGLFTFANGALDLDALDGVLLRTDVNGIIAETTIGAGLSFDGTTLTASGGIASGVSGSGPTIFELRDAAGFIYASSYGTNGTLVFTNAGGSYIELNTNGTIKTVGMASNASPVNAIGQLSDGTYVKIALSSGGGAQTPWASDIDGAAFSLSGASNITLHAAGAYGWNGRSYITSRADSFIDLLEADGVGFTQLGFGGSSSSFPAIRRVSGDFQFVLADNSEFTSLTALGYTIRATAGNVGSGSLLFHNRLLLNAPADGRVQWLNAAGTGFDRMMFGGTTASYPALKRLSAGLEVRLADDSTNTLLTVGNFTATGDTHIYGAGSGQYTMTVNSTTTNLILRPSQQASPAGLTIGPAGNVGIGTNAPGPSLDVQGTVAANALALRDYTWATKPSATNSGLTIFVSDVGMNGGSYWVARGHEWHPLNGQVVLYHSQVTLTNYFNNTSEQFVLTNTLPAGIMGSNGSVTVTPTIQKFAGGSANMTVRFNGNAGTLFCNAAFSPSTISSRNIIIGNANSPAIQNSTADAALTLVPPVVTAAVDTTAAVPIVIGAAKTVGTETYSFVRILITLTHP